MISKIEEQNLKLRNEVTKLQNLNLENELNKMEADNVIWEKQLGEMESKWRKWTSYIWVTTGVYRKIALAAACKVLVNRMKRSPMKDEKWKDFVESLTPKETGLSKRGLRLVGTGVYILNDTTHQVEDLATVAAVVIVEHPKMTTLIEIFKFAYEKDPLELAFPYEADFPDDVADEDDEADKE